MTPCAAFNRKAGEWINIPDLFSVPWEEVHRRLPQLVDWEIKSAVPKKMSEVLKPEWLLFTPYGLDIYFLVESPPARSAFGVST